jgi:uncharacterized protein YwqG
MFEAELKDFFQKEGVGARTDELFRLAQTGLHLQKQLQTVAVPQKPLFGLFKQPDRKKHIGLTAAVGASRLGGLPDVPPGFSWPQIDGKPMQFLAQINCAEIPAQTVDAPFPAEGLLYFFFDFDSLSVFKPQKNRTADCVKYAAVVTGLAPAPVPGGSLPGDFVLPAFPVKLLPAPTFPDRESADFKALDLTEVEAEGALEAIARWQKEVLHATQERWDGYHQVGGLPQCVQNEVLKEAQVITLGKEGEQTRELWAAAEKSPGDWCLLLQLDSDGDINTMWGDAGMLYFCLRKLDLAAKKFENACVVFQCH